MGLAGASLLQLAGSVDAPTSAPMVERSPSKKVSQKVSQKVTQKVLSSPAKVKRHNFPKAAPTQESVWPSRDEAKPSVRNAEEEEMHGSTTGSTGTDAAKRLSSYAVPTFKPQVSMLPDTHEAAPAPHGRISVPALLPSLGSILEGAPPQGHLKRPRQDGSQSFEGHVRASPPPAPVQGVEAEPKASDVRKPKLATQGASLTQEITSAMGGSSAGMKRLFPWRTTPKYPSDGAQGSGLHGNVGTGEVGFLTSSPGPDWRKLGIGHTGRVASLDEAQHAAERQGMDGVYSEKPRRGSAFVNEVSALTPLVTEVGRRDSAVESREMLRATQAPHYSNLLSASKPVRGLYAFPRHPPSRLQLNRDPAMEGRGEGDIRSRPRSTACGAFFGSGSSSIRRPFADGAGPALEWRSTAGGSSTTNWFHVIEAHAPFTIRTPREFDETASMSPKASGFSSRSSLNQEAGGGRGRQEGGGSSERPRGTTGYQAGESKGYAHGGQGEGGQKQESRWSVLGRGSAPPANERAVLLPAWGARMDEEANGELPLCEQTAMEVTSGSGGAGRRGSSFSASDDCLPPRGGSTVGSPDAANRMGSGSSSGRRRWSVLQIPSVPSDQTIFVSPREGAPTEEAGTEESLTREQSSVDFSTGGQASRRETGFVVGGGGPGGAGSEAPLSRSTSARRGLMAVTSEETEGVESLWPSEQRQWSVRHEASSSPHHEGTGTTSFVPAWGANPETEEQQGSINQEDTTMSALGFRKGRMSSEGVGREGEKAPFHRSTPRRGSLTAPLAGQQHRGSAMLATRRSRAHVFGWRDSSAPHQYQQEIVSAAAPPNNGLASQLDDHRPAASAIGPALARRGSCFGVPVTSDAAAEGGGDNSPLFPKQTGGRRSESVIAEDGVLPPPPSEQRRLSISGAASGVCARSTDVDDGDRGRRPGSAGILHASPRQQPAVHAEYAAAWGQLNESMTGDDVREERQAAQSVIDGRQEGGGATSRRPPNNSDSWRRWMPGRRDSPY